MDKEYDMDSADKDIADSAGSDTVLWATMFEELEKLKELYARLNFKWATKLLPVDLEYAAHIEKKYGKEWAAKVKPCLDTDVYTRSEPVEHSRILEFESRWDVHLPEVIRGFLLKWGEVHFNVDFWDGRGKKGKPVHSDISVGAGYFVKSAQLDLSLAELNQAEQVRREYLDRIPDSANLQPWANTLGLMLADNGDLIALNLETGKVLYLSCNGDAVSNGVVLGLTVQDYIHSLLRVGLVGKELHNLNGFFTEGKEGIDPNCLRAVMYRYTIGLIPRPNYRELFGQGVQTKYPVVKADASVPFESWVITQIKASIAPLFESRGYRVQYQRETEQTRLFVQFTRERNNIVQYVFISAQSSWLEVWSGSTPVYLPIDGRPYDMLRFPPGIHWAPLQFGEALKSLKSCDPKHDPESLDVWRELMWIISNVALPQLDQISSVEDLISVAPRNSLYGVTPYVNGVHQCLCGNMEDGLKQFQLGLSETEHLHHEEGSGLLFVQKYNRIFTEILSGSNRSQEAFLKIYRQVCTDGKEFHKVEKCDSLTAYSTKT